MSDRPSYKARFVIEIGPLEFYGTKTDPPGEAARMAARTRRDLDAYVRRFMHAGKRSKYVTTTMIQEET